MLVATFTTGVLNYVFNMFAGRMLGPADYGIFAALLALFTTLTSLTSIAQVVITNYTAKMNSLKNLEELRGLTWTALSWLTTAGIAISMAIILSARWLSRVFQIDSPYPFWVLAAAILPLALNPLGLGLLLGKQRFGAFGLAQIAGALLRLIGGIALLNLGLGIIGATSSLIFTTLAINLVAFVALPEMWKNWRERSKSQPDALNKVLWYVTIGTLSYALLTGMDVLIVKSRFLPVESGVYASIATVGKIALWMSSALTTLFLPKLTTRRSLGQNALPLLRLTQLAVVGLCSSLTVVFFMAGPRIMNLLFGESYTTLANLLGWYSLSMTLFALASIWFNYFLVTEQTIYIWVLAIGTTVQAAILYFFATNPQQIILGLIICGIALAVAGESIFWFNHYKYRENQAFL